MKGGPSSGGQFLVQLIRSKTDTFGTGTKCPFYRGVRLIEVSVKRESTVNHFILSAQASS